MGVYLGLVDYKNVFENIRGKSPVIINDLEAFTDRNNRDLEKILFNTYSGDSLSNIPSCEEGCTTGAYNIHENGEGVICKICNTPVQNMLDQDLQPLAWIRAPVGVHYLVNPLVWGMLIKRFTKHGFSFIEWLCDTRRQPDKVIKADTRMILDNIEQLGIKRGYNFFYENFDFIMNSLFNMRGLKLPRTQLDPMRIFLAENRKLIFTRHLPVPHRSLFVVEEAEMDTYTDEISTMAIDEVRSLAGIDTELMLETDAAAVKKRENHICRLLTGWSNYYDVIYQKKFGSKEGWCRKHLVASRAHWSFRCVITSITDPHDYKEIHIPWGVGMAVFRLHLANKLLRRGMTPRELTRFLDEHASRYHPLLDELFKEIISQSPSGFGVACTLNRNPSLTRGSIQLTYITKVKVDPAIWTVSMSIQITDPLNADFDGDALNFTLALDHKVEKWLHNLAPHLNAFSLDKPADLSGAVKLSKPVVENIANWYEDRNVPEDPDKKIRMMQLAMA